jgi:hypothetical protein
VSPQNEGGVAGNRMYAGYGEVISGGSSLGGLDNGQVQPRRPAPAGKTRLTYRHTVGECVMSTSLFTPGSERH